MTTPEREPGRAKRSGPAASGSLTSVLIRRRVTPSPAPDVSVPPNVEVQPQAPTAMEPEAGRSPVVEQREIEQPIQPAPAPAPEAPSAQAAAPNPEPPVSAQAPEPHRREDIVTYWKRLRNGRHYPSTADLDDARITADWPNSILIRRRPGSRALEPDKIYAERRDDEDPLADLDEDHGLNLSPLMLQWLVSLAGEVVREGRPMSDDDMFPSRRGSVRYVAVALPFSEDQSFVDHVLCNISPDTRGAA